MDRAARAYSQSLLLAAGLRSDLLDTTMGDPHGECMPFRVNTERVPSSSQLTAIRYPSGAWGLLFAPFMLAQEALHYRIVKECQ